MEGADEDADVAPGEEDDGGSRTGPGHALASGPAEPEEADGKHDAADHGAVEAVLGGDEVRRVAGNLLLVEELIANDHGHQTQNAANNDGEEDEAALLDGELVHQGEDVGNGSEEAEQCAEAQGYIEADAGHDRLEEEHTHRAEN